MLGQVIRIDEEFQGGAIWVRIKGMGEGTEKKVYPYLPMPFRSVPKIDELVVLVCEEEGNLQGMVYYLGPFITLPQNNERSSSNEAYGTSMSNYDGSVQAILPPISNNSETDGAFPQGNDVAVIGRSSEDIVLKEGEIDIRCGIRVPLTNDDKYGNAKVAFNKTDPAFIQMKYEKNGYTNNSDNTDDGNFNSVINLVSDKVNIISNKDFNEVYKNEERDNTHNYNLAEQKDLSKLMSEKLHPAVKGDELADVLNLLVDCFLNHYHHWFGPKEGKLNEQSSEMDIKTKIDKLKKFRSTGFANMLSQDLRIS